MDLGCYPLHMIHYFSGLTPRVINARAETGPMNRSEEHTSELQSL